MNFNAMAAKLRRDLASVPGFTVARPGEKPADVLARAMKQEAQDNTTVSDKGEE